MMTTAASVPGDPWARDGGLVRVRLDLEYDGTDFSGWAAQPGLRTVEGVLTEALATVTRTPGERLGLVVAGRTDAGVHATGQVCHLDLPEAVWARLPGRATCLPQEALARRLRGVLPCDLRVRQVCLAPPHFDARFAALCRRYAYRICDDPSGVPPLRRRDVVAHRRPLDLEAMDAASRTLVGLQDFAAYCRRREGATTVRTLLEYSWSRDAFGLVTARVVADAFCHSMVRALVGAALAVGDGRRGVGWPGEVLAGRVRDPGVVVAPAHGLVLEEVVYPDDAGLPGRVAQARARRAWPLP
jgi:tRNA pseudouridine38-40 synthase